MAVVGWVMVRIKVAALSQPILFVRWTVWLPAAEKVNPFQLKGNVLAHTLLSLLEVVFAQEIVNVPADNPAPIL